MDLADLLTAERIRCQCDIQSKKRAIQTLAELLSTSLREQSGPASCEQPETAPAKAASEGRERLENGEKRSRLGRLTGRNRNGKDKERQSEREFLSEMDIMDALIARERLGATSIGKGVALPHSRMAGIEVPIAALVTLDDGVDYEATDHQPVDIVLGLLVPEDCTDTHLQILAGLARRFNDDGLRDDLRRFDDSETLYGYLHSLPAAS